MFNVPQLTQFTSPLRLNLILIKVSMKIENLYHLHTAAEFGKHYHIFVWKTFLVIRAMDVTSLFKTGDDIICRFSISAHESFENRSNSLMSSLIRNLIKLEKERKVSTQIRGLTGDRMGAGSFILLAFNYTMYCNCIFVMNGKSGEVRTVFGWKGFRFKSIRNWTMML